MAAQKSWREMTHDDIRSLARRGRKARRAPVGPRLLAALLGHKGPRNMHGMLHRLTASATALCTVIIGMQNKELSNTKGSKLSPRACYVPQWAPLEVEVQVQPSALLASCSRLRIDIGF